MASLRKIAKIYGEKTFSWHTGVKKQNKKHSSRVARRRLNREVGREI